MVNQLAKAILITKVTELISEKFLVPVDVARDLLFNSNVIDLIEDENTGLYGESPQYVYSLFESQMNHED